MEGLKDKNHELKFKIVLTYYIVTSMFAQYGNWRSGKKREVWYGRRGLRRMERREEGMERCGVAGEGLEGWRGVVWQGRVEKG